MRTNSIAAVILGAALAFPMAALAADAPPPCETFPPESFKEITAGGLMRVIEVGDVVKERGKNLCSILLDTTRGRVQLFFTTSLTVRGDPMWKKVSAKFVPD